MRPLLAIVAALAIATYAAAPPRARVLPPAPQGLGEAPRGSIHVHTRRSDGGGTVDEVAAAAARAGLRFVVLADHGDGTRPPEAPAYRHGVLVIDAVEISTDQGHVVALGLPATPYPFGGEARDVVEDITRMGGFAIAAHPSSRKAELRWTDWRVPVDGLEYLNGDSEWRDEPAWRLARALLAYPARPVETLALLFDRDEDVLRQWDSLAATRRVVAIAASDAHGRVGPPTAGDPYAGRLALPLPGYEAMFRVASVALPQARFTSDAAADSRAALEEIRAGRVFSSIDALGVRPAFAFTAASGAHRAIGGEALPLDGPVRLEVVVQAQPDVEVAVLRDGVPVVTGRAPHVRHDAPAAPAVYRVEVRMPGAPGEPPVPWIVSNPVYVGRTDHAPAAPPAPAAANSFPVYTDGAAPQWVVEHSDASQGAVDVVKGVTGTQLLFRYAISGAASSHPFAALVAPAGTALAEHDRLTFTARASRPMRVSVQVRAPGGGPAGERWHRSVFVDTVPREITVAFADMRPSGVTSAPRPPLARVQSLLFVVDTVNTPAGTSGRLLLDDVRYER